jgi:hypothetical protein
MFAQFVTDYLSMVLLLDAYTDHNAQASPAPAPWRGKYQSTDKEVMFGNKSESDMFQENQIILIHVCMNQRPDISWIRNKSESDMFQENQIILIHFCMNQHPDIS